MVDFRKGTTITKVLWLSGLPSFSLSISGYPGNRCCESIAVLMMVVLGLLMQWGRQETKISKQRWVVSIRQSGVLEPAREALLVTQRETTCEVMQGREKNEEGCKGGGQKEREFASCQQGRKRRTGLGWGCNE